MSGAIREGRLSATEVIEAYVERIERFDPGIGAYITLTKERALRTSREADRKVSRGEALGPLHGVPIAVKDIFETNGMRTTCGSRVLADHAPERDAIAIGKLKRAGVVLLGKLSMSEFALGGPSTEFGPPCNNPWNTEYSPGGSSSGSGAAVAASLCAASLGSDTAGSIRSPASDCGIVGIKPTRDLVSRTGVIPLSWTLDSVGPMTKTVEDALLILGVIADRKSGPRQKRDLDLSHERASDLSGVTLGIHDEDVLQICDRDVAQSLRRAIKIFEHLGATVKVVLPPPYSLGKACAYAILHSEAASLHQQALVRAPLLYGRRLRMLLRASEKIPATTYLRAMRVRKMLTRRFQEVFKGIDVLVGPTKTSTASRSSERNSAEAHRRGGMFTGVFNVIGFPAMSVPCGIASNGLPIGMQVVGRPFEESMVFKVALAYQSRTEWHKMHPRLSV